MEIDRDAMMEDGDGGVVVCATCGEILPQARAVAAGWRLVRNGTAAPAVGLAPGLCCRRCGLGSLMARFRPAVTDPELLEAFAHYRAALIRQEQR
jgi:hypothetical protein